MALNLPGLWPCILVVASYCSVSRTQVDKTLEQNAAGWAVVHAVITKLDSLQDTCIDKKLGEKFNLPFSGVESYHHLLRRIAFVETEDGTRCVHAGGIWAIKKEHFNLSTIRLVNDYCNPKLFEEFSYDNYTQTNVPLLSGLAAYLYLHEVNKTTPIPLASDISGQALLWFNNYTTKQAGDCVERFIRAVDILATKEGCRVNADIFFVLDMSNSIKRLEFEPVREFMRKFVTGMRIGPNATQIGAIAFGTEARVLFYLSTYSTSNDSVNAIENITFNSALQGTATADGICKLIKHGLTVEHGYRRNSATVFKIAIIMSDGKSNIKSTECGWNIRQAANKLHKLEPQVLVYAIGIGNNNNEDELIMIATDERHYAHITEFSSLPKLQESYADDICRRETVRYEEGEFIEGTLSEDKIIRYNLSLPSIGITIQVCVKYGQMVLYGSGIYHDPNSALNDFYLEFNDTHCKDCIDCQELFINTRQPGNNWLKRSNEPAITTTVYMTFEGRADMSHFIMNSTEGDVTSHDDRNNKYPEHASNSENNTVLVALSSSGVVLLVLSCILVISSVCGYTMWHRKKKQVEEREDECGLLSVDYVEM